MNITRTNNPDTSVTLTFIIPWERISDTRERVIEAFVKEAEIPGFRKGKAPRKAVEERLEASKVYDEVLKTVIPDAYGEAVKAETLRPIVMPKITLKEAKENEDWTVEATTCEAPSVELGDYKTAIADMKAGKHKKIWVPGTEQKPEDAKDTKPTMDELLHSLLDTVKITIPEILIENEVNRLLSDLIDQTKRLGMSVDQYLSSTNRTIDTLRSEFTEQAKRTITLEFALEKIADTEGITVGEDEIETVLKTAKTEEERKALAAQRYYLASVMRRQKTLERIASL